MKLLFQTWTFRVDIVVFHPKCELIRLVYCKSQELLYYKENVALFCIPIQEVNQLAIQTFRIFTPGVFPSNFPLLPCSGLYPLNRLSHHWVMLPLSLHFCHPKFAFLQFYFFPELLISPWSLFWIHKCQLTEKDSSTIEVLLSNLHRNH